MEKYSNEVYKHLENVEQLFKRIDCFGSEYNYCFGASVPSSVLSTILLSMGGAIGGLLAAIREKNKLSGFIVNQNEKGLCLIPLVIDDKGEMQIDIEHYMNIKQEDIESVKIRTVDIGWKKVTIILHDQSKLVMHVAKKIKGFDFQKDNVKKFMECYA